MGPRSAERGSAEQRHGHPTDVKLQWGHVRLNVEVIHRAMDAPAS